MIEILLRTIVSFFIFIGEVIGAWIIHGVIPDLIKKFISSISNKKVQYNEDEVNHHGHKGTFLGRYDSGKKTYYLSGFSFIIFSLVILSLCLCIAIIFSIMVF